MAQKRMLSRRIAASKSIHALKGNDRARFIYTVLLPYTDRAGRINANPNGLKGGILEPFEYTVDEIAEALKDLAEVGLLTLYSTDEHALIAEYARFSDFNTPHPKEPESDFPGPDEEGCSIALPDGENTARASLPGKDGSTGFHSIHTPTPTEDLDLQEEDTRDFDETPEAGFTRLAKTGRSDHSEAARARAVIRRLAGAKFARENEASMLSWSRHATTRLTELWNASHPQLWPGEAGKRRSWFFTDLLNEERYPPGEQREPERRYDQPVTGADLLDDNGSLEGNWKN